jgi:hypothetical protein
MRVHATARKFILGLTPCLAALLILAACTPTTTPQLPVTPLLPEPPAEPTPPQAFYLTQAGGWRLPDDHPVGRKPSLDGIVQIEGLGDFAFSPAEVETTRPDIFAEGHFSVFDVVAHLGNKGWFPLKYHYNARLDTHVIDELDGRMNWWYRTRCPGGWTETNVFRMDMAPYRDGMTVTLHPQPEEYMGRIYSSFAEELLRKSVNLGRVIIPEVRIGTAVYTNVPVSAHDFRDDLLRPGTVTALDVLLSLADQGKLDQLKVTWYSDLGGVEPADSLRVEQIDDGDDLYDAEASEDSGFWVYETGSVEFSSFKGSNIRIPADQRVIVSPEYMTWYWLGSRTW